MFSDLLLFVFREGPFRVGGGAAAGERGGGEWNTD